MCHLQGSQYIFFNCNAEHSRQYLDLRRILSAVQKLLIFFRRDARKFLEFLHKMRLIEISQCGRDLRKRLSVLGMEHIQRRLKSDYLYEMLRAHGDLTPEALVYVSRRITRFLRKLLYCDIARAAEYHIDRMADDKIAFIHRVNPLEYAHI